MFADTLLFLHQNTIAFYSMVLVLGLCVGSFLNVAIYRIPIMMDVEWEDHLKQVRGEEIPKRPEFNLFVPNSHCPQCKNSIPFWANIPVISYLFMLGKTVCCRRPIPSRYPLTEFLCAVLTLFCAYKYGFTWQALGASVFGWGLLILIFIDIDKMLLPDIVTIPLLWAGLYANLFNVFATPRNAVVGAIAGYAIFWSIAWLFKRLRGIEGIGQGDFKLLAMLGAWLGWQLLPFIILVSSFVGAIWGVVNMVVNKSDHQEPIPFGPFLALAGLVAMFWGHDLVMDYLSLCHLM